MSMIVIAFTLAVSRGSVWCGNNCVAAVVVAVVVTVFAVLGCIFILALCCYKQQLSETPTLPSMWKDKPFP